MPPKKRERSPSTTPVPSTEAAQNDGTQIPDAEWEAMHDLLQYIYDYRTQDGFDPSKLFHRKVNKRVIPEYYETIQEPIALSTIKQKINTRAYETFSQFVRDFALIPHNAQVFNRPDSGAFQDALVIKEQLEQRLQKLVESGLITKEVAQLPDLGEIPTFEDVPVEEAEGEGEEEEDSDEEGEEDEEEEEPDLDDEGKPVVKRKRGRPPGSKTKHRSGDDEGENKRSRGRPPKLLTPMEARILAVLKGLRKPKNNRGQLIIGHFERLPDKATMPEYYAEVKNPIAYDTLKRKVKRKKYPTLEAFMADVNLMLNNAKEYNTDDSQIFKDATQLQIEAGKLYDNEKAKPDDTFADDEGKIPMPNGILHNGELYRVGEWVHLQNPNDLTKPIPAQIYRTYKNPNGQSMVNVCWYYRPEQTVHRADKHFYNSELVKTGRYRDHNIEEVEGKCYIMFYTRFFKGRPRGLPEGTEIYVCKDRYNEERHQFNTIKTWASCLPDEVRDKDYEMDLFDHPRKMKKFPSPIAYLLKDDQKETDELPKVTWGADGAPPKIGAVHRRPRTEKDSPPPEPTPPPPPPKVETPAPPRPMATAAPSYQSSALASSQQIQQQQQRPPSTGVRQTSFTAPQSQATFAAQHAQSPMPQLQQRPPSAHQAQSYNPATPHTQSQHRPMGQPMQYHHIQQQQQQHHSEGIPPNPALYAPRAPSTDYRNPPPIEVYTLPDHANLSIPAEIREQYQRDEFGRLLFFTTPPVSNNITNTNTPSSIQGHSVRYLAAKARRAESQQAQQTRQAETDERAAKKARTASNAQITADVEALKRKALGVLATQLARSSDLGDVELGNLSAAQRAMSEQMSAVAANEVNREKRRRLRLGEVERGYGDDWDWRVT
ncbi:hypothetical protein BDY17DRAFT_253500 [Neohortaea acidophila]|uniref:Uncharacterized protein n=1 Tax=Neohortaea acidophila TaxID=245834 RepID=A0A6A6PPF3_9PEZI|nr:uncharacterized protein BDY17DRAFT_253500 [Neohortaea acidophila]KAF2481892.1 hypothetical protein BDY17DRAFT_253500 [Neohortaea acidophila]